jgi:hypothetical protein
MKSLVLALAALCTLAVLAPCAAAQNPVAIQKDLEVGETVRSRLTSDISVHEDGSYYNLYVIRGAPRQQVVVEMRSRDFDAYLRGGTLVYGEFIQRASDDDGGSGTDACLPVTLGADGTYVVLATTYEPAETGEYTIRASPRP